MSDVERARALRRRHMHERQAVIFGVLLAGLAVAGLGAAAVYTGSVTPPFFARGFSTPQAEPTAPPGPCPPQNALPVSYDQVAVTVLNGTTSVGLAGATAEELRQRGFAVAGTANSEAQLAGVAQISFGVNGAAAAYTLAAQIDGADMLLVAREDAGVDLTLGAQWPGLVPADQVLLDPAAPLVGPEGCTPLEDSAAQTADAPPAQG